jgi:SAM-dependent methyltransferase
MYEYESGFFDYVNVGSLRSASALVPILSESLTIGSVLDLGCGQGAWLKVWKDDGVGDVMGVDGPYVDPENLLFGREQFRALDLSVKIRLDREFDLVQCLEVAEHLPPESSETLVDNLVAHGSLLLFSAAPPGQGGEHHVNERPHDFWRDLFLARGYVLLDFLRPRLAGRSDVEAWYRYNTFLFVSRQRLDSLPEALRVTALDDQAEIPRVEPIAYRLRCELIRRLPQRSVDAMARLKHYAVSKTRGSAPG